MVLLRRVMIGKNCCRCCCWRRLVWKLADCWTRWTRGDLDDDPSAAADGDDEVEDETSLKKGVLVGLLVWCVVVSWTSLLVTPRGLEVLITLCEE